jgi:hypothetical protein
MSFLRKSLGRIVISDIFPQFKINIKAFLKLLSNQTFSKPRSFNGRRLRGVHLLIAVDNP